MHTVLKMKLEVCHFNCELSIFEESFAKLTAPCYRKTITLKSESPELNTTINSVDL